MRPTATVDVDRINLHIQNFNVSFFHPLMSIHFTSSLSLKERKEFEASLMQPSSSGGVYEEMQFYCKQSK